MAIRYVGEAVIRIRYEDRGDYTGRVTVGEVTWPFEGLRPPSVGFGSATYDSPYAYDQMAQAAISFASYHTTDNRGLLTPTWAPAAEVADRIAEATASALQDNGTYRVRRRAVQAPFEV